MRVPGPLSAGAALAVALSWGAPAPAQDRQPEWVKRPRPEDLVAVWPKEAFAQGKGGQAVIQCTVTVQGALTACAVVSEKPEGAGFGRAAIALTPQLLMRPRLVDGKPVAGTVRIPINFAEFDPPTGSHLKGPGMTPTRRVYTQVPWVQAPSYAQVVAAYPEEAKAARVVARAALDCGINREARLTGCTTLSEEPKGMGVASAAKALTAHFLAPATDASGRSSSGGRVHLPVTFSPEMLDSATPAIGKPTWTALPTSSDVAAGFPEAARAAGVKVGRARLRCQIGAGGRLNDCTVTAEEPAGLGFGEAAKVLTQAFRMSLWTAEGLPTQGGYVAIPLRYEAPEAETAASAPSKP